mmetsp:Transcript_37771/g.125147  ORF Transcript_37771/g.125147 Transcript_37771/m.125147 type:complete len:277 (+) Transcript_37771:249-1079(+)
MTDPTPAAAARLCRLLHLAADLMATSSTSAAAARRPEEPALEIALATAANAAPAVGAALLTRGYTVVTAGAEEDEDGASNGDDTLNPIQIILSSVNDYAMQNLQTVSTTPPARARSCASWSEPSPPPKFTPMRRCAHTMSSCTGSPRPSTSQPQLVATPSAGRPRRRHGAATVAAAGAAARPRVHIRATEPAARRRGYAAPRVPSPSSERRGAGRRRARASAALLLLQARRAAPATTPRRLSLGGVEVGRARSRGRGGRHRSGRGHGGPYGRRARC